MPCLCCNWTGQIRSINSSISKKLRKITFDCNKQTISPSQGQEAVRSTFAQPSGSCRCRSFSKQLAHLPGQAGAKEYLLRMWTARHLLRCASRLSIMNRLGSRTLDLFGPSLCKFCNYRGIFAMLQLVQICANGFNSPTHALQGSVHKARPLPSVSRIVRGGESKALRNSGKSMKRSILAAALLASPGLWNCSNNSRI